MLLAASLAWPATAQTVEPAAERAALEQLRATTTALIEALVAQGLLPRDKADALLRQASTPPAGQWGSPPAASGAAAAPAKPVQRVPFISNTMREELRQQIRSDLINQMAQEGWAEPQQIPAWSRRISFGGDVRLRLQSEQYDSNNLPADQYRLQAELGASPAWAPDLVNSTIDRHRLTLRARLEMNARLSQDARATVRLSTGATQRPASASQTLGTGFDRLNVGLDRALLRWTRDDKWALTGGRMGVPFYGSSLLWPSDLSLDGAVGERNWVGRKLTLHARAGAFPLREFNVDKRDHWLLGMQAALDWEPSLATRIRASLSYYDFQKIEGVRENRLPPTGALAGTVPYLTSVYPEGLRSKGNTLINLNSPESLAAPAWGLASRFRPINLTFGGRFLQLYPLELGVQLDYVKNLGFDNQDIERRAQDPRVRLVSEKTAGFEVRGHVGTAVMNERGDWQAFVALRQFERDAWPDAYTDTTWHVGGTNYKGWAIGGTYALDSALRLGWRWTSTRNLDDGVIAPFAPTGTLSAAPFKVDVLQLEINSRF